jgi:hypothetical protein
VCDGRFASLRDREQRAKEAAERAIADRRALISNVRIATVVQYLMQLPSMLAIAWAPFLTLLFLCLKLDGVIGWSWWGVFAPLYIGMFGALCGGCGTLILRSSLTSSHDDLEKTMFKVMGFVYGLFPRTLTTVVAAAESAEDVLRHGLRWQSVCGIACHSSWLALPHSLVPLLAR